MQSKRVLLSHRDAAVLELTSRALTRIGVMLDIAADATDAVSRIGRESYDVIAIERDDAVLASIAANRSGSRPVVIVTADDKSDLDPEIISLVVPQPYDPQILVGVILACVTPETVPAPLPQRPLPAEQSEG